MKTKEDRARDAREKYANDPAYRARAQAHAAKRYRKMRYDEDWNEKERQRTGKRWKNSTVRQRLGSLVASAKCNLRRFDKETPFTLKADDLVVPEICPVLGIPIFFGGPPFSPNTPSLDRLVPKLGYTKENVRIISWRANRLKADCTDPAELRAIADYLERNLVDLF